MKVILPTSYFTVWAVWLWLGSPSWAQSKEPEWKIYQTETATADIVVAAYSVLDYGAVGDGKTDCTAAFKRALNDLKAIGGGTVFVPGGRYVIKGELEIPASTTLRGEWSSPGTGMKLTGTILMAYSGRGQEEGTPFTKIFICIAGYLYYLDAVIMSQRMSHP